MKKKVILMFLMIFLMLFLMINPCFAKTFENRFYKFDVPDNWEEKSMQETEKSSSVIFDNYINGRKIFIQVFSQSTVYVSPTTEEELESIINSKIKSYKDDDTYTLTDINGKLLEINGVKGNKIRYFVKNEYNGRIDVYEQYGLQSDNCSVSIYINTVGEVIDSIELKNIINSFKVKDTVLKSRGIPFTDVASWDWYLEAVKYVYNNGMIKGLNDYTFGPNDKLTRGMIVTILYRMEGSPAISGTSGFSDVKETEYYAKAVKWAKDKKIVSGYSGTTKFGPNDNILRQDLAGILRNYAKYKGKNVNVTSDLTKFKDYKKVDSYANASMQWAVGKKVMNGNKDGTLNPKGNASRAEAAAMLKNYCENVGR